MASYFSGPVRLRGAVFILWGLLFWGLADASAQKAPDLTADPRPDRPYGPSPLVYFSPSEIGGAGSQIWQIGQDPQGLIIALDGYGLHQYDGVRWRTFPLPFFAKAMVPARNGRIHLLGPADIGFAERQGDDLRFTSVKDQLPASDSPPRFLDLVETEQGVVYSTLNGLYRLDADGTLDALAHEGEETLRRIFTDRGRLYVQHRELGVALLSSADPAGSAGPYVPVSGPPLPPGARVMTALPWDEESSLLFTAEHGTFRLSDDELGPFALPADPFLRQHQVSDGIRTRDGRFVLTTARGGVAILDGSGELLEVLDRQTHPNLQLTTYFPFEDRQANLWIGTDLGVALVPNTAARMVVDPSEIDGSPHRTYRHQGRLYVATRTHLYRETEDRRLEKMPELKTGIWALLSMGDELLIGADAGIFVLEDAEGRSQIHKICEATAVALQTSRLFPGHVLAGTQNGFRSLSRRDGRWGCGEPIGSIPRFHHEVLETDDGAMLVLGYSHQFFHLTFPDGLDGEPVEQRSKLPAGRNELVRIGDDIFLSNTNEGLLRYRPRASNEGLPFEPDPVAMERYLPGGHLKTQLIEFEAEHNRLWSSLPQGPSLASTTGPDPFHARPLAPDQLTYWADVYTDPQDPRYTWFTNSNGVFYVDTEFRRQGPKRHTVLSRARLSRSVTDLPLGEGLETATISYEDNALEFEFAAPIFDQMEPSLYQWKLEGFEDEWSEWSEKISKEYTNLRENTYRFRVRAQDRWGEVSEEASFAFQIEPPVYRTVWAYGLYALALFGLGSLAWQVHRRSLARERAINRRLREVDQLKDELLANTSHELRTPLFGITGLAESMLDGSAGALSPEARENLSMIASSGRRLNHLVGDILDMSKMRHRRLDLQLHPLDLHPLVDVVLTLSAPLVGDRDLKLVNSVPRDLAPVQGDENRMQQIFYNLIGNAVKFTDSGKVEVTAKARGKDLVVAVRDTGIGIPVDKQLEIFEPFEQADTSAERPYGGTGLGLAVTRQLVELHGGKLWVKSTPGAGSTFYFSLRAAKGDAPIDARSPSTAVRLPVEAETSESAEALSGLTSTSETMTETGVETVIETVIETDSDGRDAIHILVVDDEPVNLQVLRHYMIGSRLKITTAADGAAALQCLEDGSFDLVLLDVMMPQMSGFEVCRVIRERYSMAELPVLFLTAKSQVVDIELGLALGANDFLPKPISRDELLARLRPHLDLLAMNRRLEELVQEKLSHINVLEGVLPICGSCKKIRDEDDRWVQMESFIDARSEASFSHGICPDCASSRFPV